MCLNFLKIHFPIILPLNPTIVIPYFFKDNKEMMIKNYENDSGSVGWNTIKYKSLHRVYNRLYRIGADVVTIKMCRDNWIQRRYQIEVFVPDSISNIT